MLSRNKYPVNAFVFLNEDDVSFYLLGAYLTDGCITTKKHQKNFSISAADKDWIESIQKTIAPTKPIYVGKSKKIYSFASSNDDILNWLLSYGCIPNKSKSVKLEKNIPHAYIADFIRGAIDGDGSISVCNYCKHKNGKSYTYRKVSVYLCGASLTFLQQVQSMIPPEIVCNLVKVKQTMSKINGREVIPKSDMYRLCFNDSHAKRFLAWIYYPGHSLSLKRKREKANEIILLPK